MRRRGFLTYLLLCLVPLLLVAVLNYWNGLRLIDQTVGDTAQRDLDSLTADVDRRVQQQEAEIRRLASAKSIGEFLAVSDNSRDQPPPSRSTPIAASTSAVAAPAST